MEAKIHPTFHVSLLKKKMVNHLVISSIPSPVTDQEQLMLEPITFLDQQLVKRGNSLATRYWFNGAIHFSATQHGSLDMISNN